MNFINPREKEDIFNLDYIKEYQYFDRLHSEKYRDKNQSRENHVSQLATNLSSNADHKVQLHDIFLNNRFIPAGRVQAAGGATEREVSYFNCSVSMKIEDNIDSIYDALKQSAKILRLGTGIGYNYSHIRPRNDLVKSLQTKASGPVSYMHVFDKSASTIASSGHRRGAQMGILNVWHPDIEEFIDSKMFKDALRYFNISVGITDDFMEAVAQDAEWNLRFGGKIYKIISARELWNKILRNAYESAEPGVVFLDRMNYMNNLNYCEEIEATNPCSEQPLPNYGLCLLGSFNLVAYLRFYKDDHDTRSEIIFDYDQFEKDIYQIVEAYDNIFDKSVYAIPEHKIDALNKRRIGLGLTGIANAIELMVGHPSYGEPIFNRYLEDICSTLVNSAYRASIELAKKRGPFPLFDKDLYCSSNFIKTLPMDIQNDIYKYGIRNSHLISYAPCGTISQIAGNISSGVEPVFYHEVDREVYMKDGKEKITLKDYAWREYGFKGKTLEECTINQHLSVGEICQRYCDSAVSKTINVAPDCTYEEYVEVYNKAYELGLKGITVYRPTDLRGAVITKSEENKDKKPVEPVEPVNSSEFGTFTCASGACER